MRKSGTEQCFDRHAAGNRAKSDLRGVVKIAIGRPLGRIGESGMHHRSHRGFNFFAAGDLSVLLAIMRGEYHLSGLSNRLL